LFEEHLLFGEFPNVALKMLIFLPLQLNTLFIFSQTSTFLIEELGGDVVIGGFVGG